MLSDLEIMDLQGKTKISLPEVYTQKQIPVAREDILTKEDLKEWQYLDKVKLPQVDAEVGLLIGNNVPQAMEPLEVINSKDGGPFACRSVLGWQVYGSKKVQGHQKVISHKVTVKARADVDEQLQNLFNHDFNERIIEDRPEKSKQDEIFTQKVESSIRKIGDHYEIALPLKEDEVRMPNNRPQAEQRAAHLQRRFRRQPEFQKEYTSYMESMLNKGYMEEVPDKEAKRDDGRLWYLPHHGVIHPQKNKIRVVYDCTANYRGASLNKQLLQGPDLTNSLLGVLTRFRQDKVALMSDIEGMFSQVLVPKEDRDLLRLLWWDGGDTQKPLTEYRMKVHVFGAVSSPSCANYALK